MNDQDQLMTEARIGIELEKFQDSEVGTYLYTRAEIEKKNELERFKSADPTDERQMVAIHLRLRAIEKAIDWIEQGVQNGQFAASKLREQEVCE